MAIRNPNPNRAYGTEIVAESVSGLDTTTYKPPFYEGVIVDIVLNEEHPEYNTNGFNVGRALIRPLNNAMKNTEENDDNLHWCDPLEMRFAEYPLKGEMVLIWIIAEVPFYTKPLYIGKKPTENAYLNLNKTLKRAGDVGSPATSNGNQPGEHQFGEYFKPLKNSHYLRPFEGDVIIHGRFGNTIRFGSSQIGPDETGLNPNILIRVGEPPQIKKVKDVDNPQGLVYEDVNMDASSFYMVADQRIPLEPGPKTADSYLRSANETTGEFIGSQILLNSDKITINSKRNEIFILATEGIHGSAIKDITFDTDQNFKVSTNIDTKFRIGRNFILDAKEDAIVTIGRNTIWTSKTRISAHANKIFVGSKDDDAEPFVGGTALSKFLARIIQALAGNIGGARASSPPLAFIPGLNTNIHVITPVGPAVLAPAVVQGLTALYNELIKPNSGQDAPTPFAGAPFNSKDNFVSLDNKDPQITEIPAPMNASDREALERYKAELLEQTALVQDSDGAATVDEEISFIQQQLSDNELAADEVEDTVEISPDISGICKTIVDAAKTNLGLRELNIPDTINNPPKRQPYNSNTHPIIDTMFRACGLDNVGEFRRSGTGFHWCAAAVTNWWKSAGADVPPNTIKTPQGRKISGGPASVQHWFEWASAFGYLSDTPVVGAAALYYDSNARRYNHIGIVASVNPLITIEGNTSDPSGGFNRNGIGCFEKRPRITGSRRIKYVLPVQGGRISPCALRQLGRTE
jgi:hypothetical protein